MARPKKSKKVKNSNNQQQQINNKNQVVQNRKTVSLLKPKTKNQEELIMGKRKFLLLMELKNY
jgi:hypothetical protein